MLCLPLDLVVIALGAMLVSGIILVSTVSALISLRRFPLMNLANEVTFV